MTSRHKSQGNGVDRMANEEVVLPLPRHSRKKRTREGSQGEVDGIHRLKIHGKQYEIPEARGPLVRSSDEVRVGNSRNCNGRPTIDKCSDTLATGDERNGCQGDRFSTVRPDPTCDQLCQKYRECEREVDATAREMARFNGTFRVVNNGW